ncbi:membrane metallo-endopeptidase-like 1 isoform X4 [Lineus longissimus]|uniref:membrane metallo-endopeptidase-like 1 isoform X4 n=1 Tax=Lineus longissimus TaxID=88925 RepID=UPI00315D288A
MEGKYRTEFDNDTNSSTVEIAGTNASINTMTPIMESQNSRKRGWFKRRTGLELGLFALFFLMFVVAVALLIILVTQDKGGQAGPSGSPQKNGQVCYSADCVVASARLMEGMNRKADPCDDFYEYACGNWIKKNIIPEDQYSINTFSVLRDELQVQIRGLLEKPVKPSHPASVVKSKHLYTSCVNESLIDERDLTPMWPLLNELGGWPVLNKTWDDSKFDLVQMLVKLRLYNNRLLINHLVSPDDKQSDKYINQLDQASLAMPNRDYYLKGKNDTMLQAYQTLATGVAIAFGAEKAFAEQEISKMIDFEIELANITIPEDQRRDSEANYHKMTVRQLSQNVSGFDWLLYLNSFFKEINVTLTADDLLVVHAPAYLKNLVELVQKTNKRTLATYLVWRITQYRVSNLPLKYRELTNQYNKVIFGSGVERPRWRTCVSYVQDRLGWSVGRLFVEEYFDDTAKSHAEDMIHNIRKAFNDFLTVNTWMDNVTKRAAKEKADAISEKIGYPEFILNNTALDEKYEELTFYPNLYFENVLENLKVSAIKNLELIKEDVDKTKWSSYPAVVNAFYSSSRNQIMFPAGILQPPFFSPTNPKSLNYGGIGMVIGHEITHGFDDQGRQFDKDGNLKQWWGSSVVDAFKNKAQCIIDQYGNYTVAEVNMNLNGVQTQGENIADNGGLKQAYKAYREWVVSQGHEEPKLPGINLENNQLFFLNFAQIWCGDRRPASAMNKILTGVHSINRFRVIGSVSNSQEFAEAYKCPVGSKMNPNNKCAVW